MKSNHHTLRVVPLDAQIEIAPEGPLTSATLVSVIERSFKRQLLTTHVEDERINVTVVGLRPLSLVIKRFGMSALLAGVAGHDGTLESLTLCRAGLDNGEDGAALAAAAQLILSEDASSELRRCVHQLTHDIREKPRPLAVHIHLHERNAADPSVRIVTHGLAECFFDMFGLDKAYETTDI